MAEAAQGEWGGGAFGARARCLLAPNPGIMTLDGTNTWLLREPGATRSVVIDPGPIEEGHLDVVDEAAGDVALILLTHHHFDHSEVAADLAARKGCPVRAVDPAWCVDGAPLADDEEIEVDGLRLRAVLTPGHTADSVSFVVPDDGALLTGDMVLGRGTTVVAHPDGALAPYFTSIERMRALVSSGEVAALWPAHGPVLADGGLVLDHYLAHRRDRLEQVRVALRELGEAPSSAVEGLPRRVVEVVYRDVDEMLWPAAELSVRAQLEFLAAE